MARPSAKARVTGVWSRVRSAVEAAPERPRLTLGIATAVVVLAVAIAAGLAPSASPKLLVSPRSDEAKANTQLDRELGADPIAVVVEGDLRRTISPGGLGALLEMEGRASRLRGVRSVYGPATFINQTVVQFERLVRRELGGVADQARVADARARRKARSAGRSSADVRRAGAAARERALGSKTQEYSDLLVRLGSLGPPGLGNQQFVNTLVYGAGTEPKQRFRWLFPSNNRAVIAVRPDPGVEGAQMLKLGEQLRALARAKGMSNFRVRVGGAPLVAAALERDTRSELLRLAPVGIGAMILLLVLALRRRPGKLVPLALALGSVALTAAVGRVLGLGLTPATLAALPAVLGLALDFAIQVQARYWAERSDGAPAPMAAVVALHAVGPTLVVAGVAMAVGFSMMLLSSVPLLDRLGATLAIGVLASLAFALAVGPALLCLTDRGPVDPVTLPAFARARLPRIGPRVAAVLGVVALAGIALSGHTAVQSDLAKLSPPGQGELRDLRGVQESIGTSGPIRVAVTGKNVTDPAVLRWMQGASGRILKLDSRLRPGPNLADIVAGSPGLPPPDEAAVARLLKLIPKYFQSAVLGPDRRITEMSFNAPLTSFGDQAKLVRRIDGALGDPPAGVKAQPAGILVAGATSTESLESTRPWLVLLAAGVIGLLLYALWRRVDRVVLVLAPALIAAGVSALALALSGIALSPLAAGLELMVLAVGLEFGMLLEMRYRQARASGASPAAARETSGGAIGPAMALSAGTAAIGFATLGVSSLPMLSQLGLLVAAELVLCAVLALVLVPGMAEWLERRGPLRLPALPRMGLRRREQS